jgi:hypothetical protein
MLQSKRQNFHHSKFPELGEIVKVPHLVCNRLNGIDPNVKHIVIAFPLCDNVRPYSIGIHTCYIQSLKDKRVFKISGFLLVDNEN